jgi:hypothetical protein
MGGSKDGWEQFRVLARGTALTECGVEICFAPLVRYRRSAAVIQVASSPATHMSSELRASM